MNTSFKRAFASVLIVSLIALHVPLTFADSPAASEAAAEPAAGAPVLEGPAPETPLSDTLLVAPREVPADPLASSTVEASSTPVAADAADTGTTTPGAPDVLAVSTVNEATTTTALAVDAGSGNNVSTSTDPGALPQAATTTIVTGDAVAAADVVNVVNVNVFNSDVLFMFLSRLAGGFSNIDLRNIFAAPSQPRVCADCAMSTSSPSADQASVSAVNTAVIDNAVVIRSSTGGNSASSTGGSAIDTGNAYATANVLNMANATIMNSQYLMLMFNNYGGLSGDIILPSAAFFQSFLRPQQNGTSSVVAVGATNTAAVSTAIDASAETGNNTATTTGSSVITTGDAQTGATVINNINQNHVGGSRVAIVFRVFGNWLGNVFNMPASLMIGDMPVGIQFVGSGNAGGQLNSGTLSTENTAAISNRISVSASTGGNSASGSSTSITTGDAYAAANVVNVANTNIIGSNWIQAIINIFGDWNGNVSFGQPNLWVGTRADFKNGNSGAGSEVTFRYTLKNNGDAPAHNVRLSHSVDSGLLALGDRLSGGLDIGTLAPGEIREVSETAQVANTLPAGNTSVVNTIAVRAAETDGDASDNTDTLGLVLTGSMIPVSNSFRNPIGPANFSITKTASATSTAASSTVNYQLHIVNNGGYTGRAIVRDVIRSESGEVINSESWDLGAVFAYEEIDLAYAAFFNASTTPGVYSNSAQVVSPDGTFRNSAIATTSVTIVRSAPGILAAKALPPKTAVRARSAVKTELSATSTATSTIAETDGMILGMIETNHNSIAKGSLLASAFAALGSLSWYWYAALTGAAGIYFTYRNRRLLLSLSGINQ